MSKKFTLIMPRWHIVATSKGVDFHSVRDKMSLFFDLDRMKLILRYSNLIEKFLNFSGEGEGSILFIGVRPSPEVLDGKIPEKPFLYFEIRNGKVWMGYLSQPSRKNWRYRQRIEITDEVFSNLVATINYAMDNQDHKSYLLDRSEEYWVLKGCFGEAKRQYSFCPTQASIEIQNGERLLFERAHSEFWESATDIAEFMADYPGSSAEDYVPDDNIPHMSLNVSSTGDEIKCDVFVFGSRWCSVVADQEFYSFASALISLFWNGATSTNRLVTVIEDEDEEDEGVGA